MRRLAILAAMVGATLVLPQPVGAAAPLPMPVTAVDLAGFPVVTATVTVPPALAGRAVPPEAFTATENGKPVTASVTPLPAEQLEVIVVVDTSGSMTGTAMAEAKRAANAFLGAMPPATQIALVGFGETPVLAHGFSLDRAALAGAVNGFVARGETALYDAIAMAVAQFPPASGARRSVVLLSDGGDTRSQTTLEAAAAQLAAARVHVDAVELLSSEVNSAALAQLAAGGGGRVVPVGDPAALNAVFSDIASALASQYRVTFQSGSSGPTELGIAVAHEGVTAEGRVSVDLPAPPPSPPTTVPTPVLVQPSVPTVDGRLLAVGTVAFFVAMYLVTLVALVPRRRRSDRLARLGRAGSNQPVSAPAVISGLADRATHAADAVLERRGRRGALNSALERAGIALRPGEFVVLCGCGALVALLMGVLLSGAVVGLVGVVLVAAGSRLALVVLAGRRQAAFAGQLGDTLQVMVGNLRAGFGLLQAFDAVGREAESPTAEEFRRVVVESRLGRALPESLHAMAQRIQSEDFRWVVGAIEINREVGGDLAEVLDTVAGTIRERDFIRRQVKSLSAEGRMSAYVLLVLPVVVAGSIRLENPTYFAELTRGGGLVMAGVGVALMLAGAVWLRKICRLVF